jgi:uncharacterized protein (TIGR00299 family) protein
MTAARRQLWVDASAGIAGDMLLGALIDAGANPDVVQRSIDAVIPGSVQITSTTVTRAGLRALKTDVEVLVVDPSHRTWRSIRHMLVIAELRSHVRERALAVFGRLAEAEAHVHGIPTDDVHFHEVGALDSIADIVGVCAALDDLDVVRVAAGEVAVGSGRVHISHGDLPVPVPAVIELARGWRIRAGGSGELATPTGMALIVALAAECSDLPSMSVLGVGVGAGTRDVAGSPNVVRVILGHAEQAAGTGPEQGSAEQGGGDQGSSDQGSSDQGSSEEMVVMEANIDDLDPRLWPGVVAELLDAGAADAWLTPIGMKKGRPAHTVAVLSRAELAASLRDVLFEQTSTIGIRQSTVRRFALPRMFVELPVAGGSVAIKIAHRDGVIVRVTPEFDDVAAAAAASSSVPSAVLQESIAAAWQAGLRPGAPVPAEVLSEWTPQSTSRLGSGRAVE